MKKFYFISTIVVALIVIISMSSFVITTQQNDNQTTEEGYVILRTTEIYGMMPSSIITIYEDGTVEKTALKKLNAKTMEENMLVIHSKLNELKNNGYKLVSTAGGSSDNIICTTYIFSKKSNEK